MLSTGFVIVVDKSLSVIYSSEVDPIYPAFAQNLRRWRQARALSQVELSERTGIGRATIASIEGSRQAVLLHQAVALANALQTQLTELIQPPLDGLEELRGQVADEDLQKILEMTKGLR